MNITNLKESIEALRELNKNNSTRFDKETDLLEYNIEEGSISKEMQNLKEQGILRKRQENPSYKYRTSIIERLEAKDE